MSNPNMQFHDWTPPEAAEVPSVYRKAHPDMSFRWLHEGVISQQGMRHFQFVEKHPSDPMSYPDSRVRRGDLCLAMMPKKMNDKRNQYYQDRRDRRLSSVRRGGAMARPMAEMLKRNPGMAGMVRRTFVTDGSEEVDEFKTASYDSPSSAVELIHERAEEAKEAGLPSLDELQADIRREQKEKKK